MRYDPNVHHRRSSRLRGYDYSRPGAYFVTVCTHEREMVLGNAQIQAIVRIVWDAIPDHFPGAAIDEFIVMPNHVHGIIWITETRSVGAQHAAPLRPVVPAGSLAAIVRSFKSAAAKRINEFRGTRGPPVWQRNYYERIIRDEDELNDIRQYIRDNPKNWKDDPHNPDHS